MDPDPLLPLLGFDDVYKFLEVKLDSTTKPRVVEEGQKVLNAKHIVSCSVTMKKNGYVQFMAQVISSCFLTNKKPHEVSISVRLDPPRSPFIESHCGCQAGNIPCKHTSAVLFHIQRVPFGEIPFLTCTEVAQQWGKLKKRIDEQYEPVPAKRFVCEDHLGGAKSSAPNLKLDTTAKNHLLSTFVKVPSGTLNCLFRGRGSVETPRRPLQEVNTNTTTPNTRPDKTRMTPQTLFTPHKPSTEYTSTSRRKKPTPPTTEKVVIDPTLIPYLNNIITEGHLHNYIKDFTIPKLGNMEAALFKTTMCLRVRDSVFLAFLTIHQSSGHWWKTVKCGRISGSIAYPLWTYYKNTARRKCDYAGWEKKIEAIYFPKFSGNSHTDRGTANEPLAQAAYEKKTGYKVTNLGVIVAPQVPWFAYSPDGIVRDHGVLVEFKCPAVGESMSALAAAAAVNYIVMEGDKMVLNNNHKFYGQVQLGMGLLGFKMCHFCVYSTKNEGEVEIIEVPRNDSWLRTFVNDLSQVYFHCVLPYFATKRTVELKP